MNRSISSPFGVTAIIAAPRSSARFIRSQMTGYSSVISHPTRTITSASFMSAREDVIPHGASRLAPPAAAADQRGAQAILVVHVGVTEKSEVAQPDVVHGRGFARAGAGDGAVAHIELQGAADAAQRAHAGHRLIVPWPGGEPIRLGRQRAHGADGDGVADKLRLHRQSERRVYLAVE